MRVYMCGVFVFVPANRNLYTNFSNEQLAEQIREEKKNTNFVTTNLFEKLSFDLCLSSDSFLKHI